MILEDIQLTGNSNIKLPAMPLVDLCRSNSKSFLNLKKFFELTNEDWFTTSLMSAKRKMTSDTDLLIIEATNEIEKAKRLAKEKFPKEYKKEFWKVIKKHSIKSLLGWLLTLRSTRK
jgi:hypothetical protein